MVTLWVGERQIGGDHEWEKEREKDRGSREIEKKIGREKERERESETDVVERERERGTGIEERSRVIKIKNIKKQNLLYGCFKKQSTQKISNQKMKLKERDKSILEYVQCMYNNVHAYKVPGF